MLLLVVCLGTTLAGCDRELAAEADADADAEQHEQLQDRAAPCEPGVACPDYGERCVVGDQHCVCTSPCTGVELLPEESYSRWACRRVDPRCPRDVPEPGSRCARKDLRCGWGTCGGSSAVCEGGRWTVHHHGPPP